MISLSNGCTALPECSLQNRFLIFGNMDRLRISQIFKLWFFFFSFEIYLFAYLFRERESTHSLVQGVGCGEKKRERERNPQADSPLSPEPDTGLDPRT